ncbi:MAG: PadR family transcriptional regulator [Candidatus Aenigmarchaeota archaeon]|nr:PadR family transcriptional regulator [Candidatus Aenigmarchaeota archaeon]
MSEDRHIIRIVPHRKAPPSSEEIFGKRPQSEMELGMLQMQILWFLNRKPAHGYEIMETLNKIKTTKITQGTLYPTLQRLEELMLVKGKKDDRKIVYTITQEGRKVMNNVCNDFTRTFFGIFQDYVCHKCVGEKDDKHS